MTIEAIPPSDAAATAPIRLNDKTTYQQIDGFGSCFNEYGWDALMLLDEAAREQVLKALFSPDGANFSLGRMPIGANDFADGYYSFDDSPGDFSLKHFSIDRDRKSLLPFIRAAMKYQPNLGVWAVPWSPPLWLTTNGDYKHGRMKQDSQSLATYALYFSKFVQAYRNAGIHLYVVMQQNEPKYNNNIYPQAAWTGAEINTFLRDYLAPQLKRDHVAIQLWEGTIVNDNLADYNFARTRRPSDQPAHHGCRLSIQRPTGHARDA